MTAPTTLNFMPCTTVGGRAAGIMSVLAMPRARRPARRCYTRRLASFVLSASLLVAALQANAQPVAVSAAASLREVLPSVNAAYEKLNRERVSTVYGPSFRLANDIARGAAPDVFISADPASVDYLEERKLVRGDVLIALARNRLVLVTREGYAPAREGRKLITVMQDMTAIALPDPRQHPAGKFAQSALTNLGLWDRLGTKIRNTTTTRATLDLLASGEVDGAIVYRSEALRAAGVRIVQALPESSHPPIIYTVAVTTRGRGWPAVSAYVSYLRSQASLDIFERYGFERDAAWKK